MSWRVEEPPAPSNRAEAMRYVFAMAREMTGTMPPGDRIEHLAWLDRMEGREPTALCAICTKQGHYARDCDQRDLNGVCDAVLPEVFAVPPRAVCTATTELTTKVRKRRPKTCSVCGDVGHTRRRHEKLNARS